MKGGGRRAKRDQPGKHASGPTGNREVGCGTAVLYDTAGERLQTMRYGRMPAHRKVSLQQQLQAEAASIVALRPDLIRVRLADLHLRCRQVWRGRQLALVDRHRAHLAGSTPTQSGDRRFLPCL